MSIIERIDMANIARAMTVGAGRFDPAPDAADMANAQHAYREAFTREEALWFRECWRKCVRGEVLP